MWPVWGIISILHYKVLMYRRRVILRLCIPADLIVLDEPFAEMEQDQADKALSYILGKQGSRPILIATQEELPIKGSKIIRLY